MNKTLKSALHDAGLFFHQLENPRLEAEVLLASLLGKPRVWLKTHDQESLRLGQWLKFWYWCWRRSRGVPVAYICGYQDWFGQQYVVNRHVLIPRSETETLLHHILTTNDQRPTTDSVLDIGTGSGCLAIELKRACPEAVVTGLDISKPALKVARKNADRHQQVIDFKHSDLLSSVPERSHFDLIVANLPYVPDTKVVTKEVKCEPAGAIFSGPDGLSHYRELLKNLNKKSIQFKQLWLEFLPEQQEKVSEIFSDYKVSLFTDVSDQVFFARITDLGGDIHPQKLQ